MLVRRIDAPTRDAGTVGSRPTLLALFLLLAAPAAAAPPQDPVTLLLFSADNAQYAVPGHGGAAEFVAEAATRAGVPIIVEGPLPFAQVLRELPDDSRPACVSHVMRTPEREARLWFSPPLEPGQRMAIMARADDRRIDAHRTLEGLLADPSLTLGWRLGVSYGTEADAWVRARKPRIYEVSADRISLVDLLERGQIDYFLSREDSLASLAVPAQALARGTSRVVRFADAPLVPAQHLVCNGRVPETFRRAVGDLLAGAPAAARD